VAFASALDHVWYAVYTIMPSWCQACIEARRCGGKWRIGWVDFEILAWASTSALEPLGCSSVVNLLK